MVWRSGTRQNRGQPDVSAGGFRMVHDCRSIDAGQVVEFSHLEAAGRARVVWSRILDQRVESGFVVMALGPRRGSSGRRPLRVLSSRIDQSPGLCSPHPSMAESALHFGQARTVRKADAKLMQQRFLLGVGFSDAAEPKLATVGGGKNNVGALQRGEQGESFHGRQRLSVYRHRSPKASAQS